MESTNKCVGCKYLDNGKCAAISQCMGDIEKLYDRFKEDFIDSAREHMEEATSEKELEMVYDAMWDSLDAMQIIIKGDLYYDAQYALNAVKREIENKRGYGRRAPYTGAPDTLDF